MVPKLPLTITGSRDSSLRIWKLPLSEDKPFLPTGPSQNESECPYFVRTLQGHHESVRAIAAHADTLVSGSYDCTVRVWKISTGENVHCLQGHTQKVYSVVLDHKRNGCIIISTSSGDTVAWRRRILSGFSNCQDQGETVLWGTEEVLEKPNPALDWIEGQFPVIEGEIDRDHLLQPQSPNSEPSSSHADPSCLTGSTGLQLPSGVAYHKQIMHSPLEGSEVSYDEHIDRAAVAHIEDGYS